MAPVGVGERLRNARTARGLTLGDIEAATRIKQQYLDALEREAWDELPGATYVRGFLASYARHLGISTDEILGLSPSVQTPFTPLPRSVEVRITPGNPQSRLRRIVKAIAVIVVAGAVVLAYVVVGQLRQFAATRPRPEAPASVSSGAGGSAGSQSAAPQPAGASAVTPPSGGQAPGAPPPAPGPAGGPTVAGTSEPPATGAASAGTLPVGQNIVITAQATDRSWVRVVSDDSVVFEGFVSAGDHQVWQGRRRVSIRVGNASALDLSVNGQSVGRLGNPGDVAERTFSVGGPVGGTPAPATAPSTPAAAPAPPAKPPAPAPAAPARPAPSPAQPATPTVTPTAPPANQHQ